MILVTDTMKAVPVVEALVIMVCVFQSFAVLGRMIPDGVVVDPTSIPLLTCCDASKRAIAAFPLNVIVRVR